MNRVWKPLSIGGLRLYSVTITDMRLCHGGKGYWRETKIVAAKSPSHARQLIEKAWKGAIEYEYLTFSGMALNVYQPESWWRDGVPCLECEARDREQPTTRTPRGGESETSPKTSSDSY